MKAKVLKTFVCKDKGKLQIVGSIVDYDDKRISDLAAKGFVEKIDVKPDKS